MRKRVEDTHDLTENLRKKSVDLNKKACLITNLRGTEQEKDLTLPTNCQGFGRIHHFRLTPKDSRWMPDPLPMLPANKYLNIPQSEVVHTQVFQLAACNFHCWYCFVDHNLLSANPKYSSFVTAKELLGYMLEEEVGSSIIDLSGGQPDIVPEYVLWFLQAREEMGLEKKYFVWTDDNLSTDSLWRYLSRKEIEYMVETPGFARVGCLKGFDPESFAFNTGADKQMFDQQIDLLSDLVETGFDQYGYITLTALNLENLENKISGLFDEIQERVHPNFPLRIIPLQIFHFNANKGRYIHRAEENQYKVIEVWKDELNRRFSKSELKTPITEVSLKR
ncbi:MAG: radical SAM protein [Candidatus Pacebacteria bacterium]|nr:radical SAM protein [Candidatus Paceibacterota bacterium]